jgi:hypothetical protein
MVTDAAVIARAEAAVRQKYGWQSWMLDLFSRLSGRFKRRAWIEIAP